MWFPYYVLILRKRSWWGHSTAFLSHNKSWRLRWGKECWTSILTLTFSRTLMARAVSSMHWLLFTTKEIPRYSFVFESEWTPGLLNLDRWSKVTWKFPRTLLRIEPGTYLLMAQCLNQLRTARSGWCSVGDYLCWCNDKWVYPERQFSVHKCRTHIAKLVMLHLTLVPLILITVYHVIKM